MWEKKVYCAKGETAKYNYMRRYKLTLYFILIAFASCINNRQTEEQIPPPRVIDFGVVVEDSIHAIQTKLVVKDNDVYQLLNDAILPHGLLKDPEKLKLLNLTTSDIRYSIKFPLTDYCSKQDSIAFFLNIDTLTYSFDCSQLTNTICISVPNFLEIFCLDIQKGWTDFRNKYGNYGLHYFSVPLFNHHRTKAIIISGGNGSDKIGSKKLLFLKKTGNKWTVHKEVVLEII